MNDLEYLFRKLFCEFLKNILFCVRDGCFNVNRFFKNATFILISTVFGEKTVKLKLPSRTQNSDFFSKIQKMPFTIDIQALSCQKAKNLMNK